VKRDNAGARRWGKGKKKEETQQRVTVAPFSRVQTPVICKRKKKKPNEFDRLGGGIFTRKKEKNTPGRGHSITEGSKKEDRKGACQLKRRNGGETCFVEKGKKGISLAERI